MLVFVLMALTVVATVMLGQIEGVPELLPSHAGISWSLLAAAFGLLIGSLLLGVDSRLGPGAVGIGVGLLIGLSALTDPKRDRRRDRALSLRRTPRDGE